MAADDVAMTDAMVTTEVMMSNKLKQTEAQLKQTEANGSNTTSKAPAAQQVKRNSQRVFLLNSLLVQ